MKTKEKNIEKAFDAVKNLLREQKRTEFKRDIMN